MEKLGGNNHEQPTTETTIKTIIKTTTKTNHKLLQQLAEALPQGRGSVRLGDQAGRLRPGAEMVGLPWFYHRKYHGKWMKLVVLPWKIRGKWWFYHRKSMEKTVVLP